MHGGLIDLGEWLGYEVVERDGEKVVRHRLQSGKWAERDQSATAAEEHLYAAVRALLMTPTTASDVGMRVVAKALGVPVEQEGVSIKQILDSIARTLEDSRKRLEAYQKAEALVNDLRVELITAQENVQRLLAVPRVGPKGGDRGELARQVRLAAKRAAEQDVSVLFRDGVERMASVVLRLLGDDVEPLDLPPVNALAQQVAQLKADRWYRHPEGRAEFHRNEGEQNAFNMVLRLLETGEVPS